MTYIFVNIIIFLSPMYNNGPIIGVVNKKLHLVKQFYYFYKSIKKNWTFPNRITLIHSTDFTKDDFDFLSQLDIDIIKTKPDFDHSDFRWHNAWQRYIVKTKIKGTHRLICECDQLAIKNPQFDYNVDFQAGFAGSIQPYQKKVIEKFIKNFNLITIPNEKYKRIKLFEEYNVKKTNYKLLFPHFNNGIILVKEKFAKKVYDAMIDKLFIIYDDHFWKEFDNITQIKHHSIQLLVGLVLITLTQNWKPLPIGCNFITTICNPQTIGRNNVSHVHYCGKMGYEMVLKYYPNYFKE